MDQQYQRGKRDYAFAVLSLHKQPRRRLIISWFGADNPARALGVDFSDRVTVIERDSGVSYFVEAIRHELTIWAQACGDLHPQSTCCLLVKTFVFDTSAFDTGTFGF